MYNEPGLYIYIYTHIGLWAKLMDYKHGLNLTSPWASQESNRNLKRQWQKVGKENENSVQHKVRQPSSLLLIVVCFAFSFSFF
jgi:hypothetical protein